ncbi:MAG: hypothetical protein IKH30_15375 [Clostridia bacterium]|nr:hypothetical protein [Clostridia bacterium]MBR4539123.1 hypothetical protein [Clostridia bacterium]
MRKAMTVILWLGLAACAVLLISLSGQKNALREEMQKETRKNEVLQTLYDQKKDEWTEQEAALTQERDDLLRETQALVLERDALLEALKIARQETQAQRQTADALTAERETASGRLSEVLSMLLTPVTELSISGAETEDIPEIREQKAPPLPGKGVQAVPFAE